MTFPFPRMGGCYSNGKKKDQRDLYWTSSAKIIEGRGYIYFLQLTLGTLMGFLDMILLL